jgi:UDP-glucose 4-epimerase
VTLALPFTKMRILITGGAGFIGSHLVDRLVSNDAGEVIVLDNLSRGRLQNLSRSIDRIRLVTGDIRDRMLLKHCMQGVDLVYHLAAQSNVLNAVRDIDYSFETNVVGTFEVLKAAKETDVERLIFTSSREVYGEPLSLPVPETAPLSPRNAYGASKAAGEIYCRVFAGVGLEIVILRLANVYGPRDFDRVIPLFSQQAVNGETLNVFGTAKILDFLWIVDLIDVLCKAASRPCPETPVNVGSGKGTRLIDLAHRISLLVEGGSAVEVTDNRQPEVNRFIADVTRAQQLFDLACPDDPIEHLPRITQEFTRNIRVSAVA